MKTMYSKFSILTIALLLASALASPGRAQVAKNPPFSPNDFMIGGMIQTGDFHPDANGPNIPSDIITNSLLAGFNTFWNWDGSLDYRNGLSLLPPTMYGIDGSSGLQDIYINSFVSYYSSEFRLFVATNEDPLPGNNDPFNYETLMGTYDLDFMGSSTLDFKHQPINRALPTATNDNKNIFEYEVLYNDGTTLVDEGKTTDPTLTLKVHMNPTGGSNAGFESTLGHVREFGDNNGNEVEYFPSSGAVVDFIYSVDGTLPDHNTLAPISTEPDKPLYYLTYNVTYSAVNWNATADGPQPADFTATYTAANQTDPNDPYVITYNKWNNYSDAKEHPYIIHFPRQATNSADRYSVLRTATGTPGTTGTLFPDLIPDQKLTSTATGGTFTLTFQGNTTSSLNSNAAASDVQTALAALSNVGTGNVFCTGGPLNTAPIVCFFTAAAQGPLPAITINSNLTGGTITNDYVETQTITSTATSGTFTMSYGSAQTASFDCSTTITAASLQSALQGLSTIGVGNVTCTGGPLNTAPIVCTFTSALAGIQVPALGVNSNGVPNGESIQSSISGKPTRPFMMTNISCELHSLGVCNMYVRGWRLRSKLADDILRGNKDQELKTIINNYRNALAAKDGSASHSDWNGLQYVTTSSEEGTNGFRTMAYIDYLFQKQTGGKQFFNFMLPSGDATAPIGGYYRSIYEDQNGWHSDAKPPILTLETYAAPGDNANGAVLPVVRG